MTVSGTNHEERVDLVRDRGLVDRERNVRGCRSREEKGGEHGVLRTAPRQRSLMPRRGGVAMGWGARPGGRPGWAASAVLGDGRGRGLTSSQSCLARGLIGTAFVLLQHHCVGRQNPQLLRSTAEPRGRKLATRTLGTHAVAILSRRPRPLPTRCRCSTTVMMRRTPRGVSDKLEPTTTHRVRKG